MAALIPLIARCLVAACLLAFALPAFAQEEEFSVAWLENREIEMTAALTISIERESSSNAARNVMRQLGGSPYTPRLVSRAATAAVPAAIAADVEDLRDAVPAPASRMLCGSGADRNLSCVIHPAH